MWWPLRNDDRNPAEPDLGLAKTHDSSLQRVSEGHDDADGEDIGLRQTRLSSTGGSGAQVAAGNMQIQDIGVSRVGETRSPVPPKPVDDVSVARTLTPADLDPTPAGGDEVALARTMTPEQLASQSSAQSSAAVVRTLTPEQYRAGLVETMGRAAAFELPREGTDGGGAFGTRQTMASDPGDGPVDPRSQTMASDPRMRRAAQVDHDLAYQQQKAAIRARLLGGPVQVTTIGRFQILRQLGEGGMGVVYAAYDDKLDRKIAIKVLRGKASRTARARLLREAQALAKVVHPNIVGVHEVGEHDGQIYLAMEFVRGQSLNEWIEQPRPWREVLEVFKQAAIGLDVAHRHNLVHRDFKPHNAILSEDGVTKVLDFGLARTGEQAELPEAGDTPGPKSLLSEHLTHTGAIMGTPAYMSPEQHSGLQATAQSDQFSFCIALYEALYGQHPYDTSSLSDLVMGIVEGKINEPPRGTDVPQWVRKIVWRGLSVAPEDRFASMAEVVAALAADPAKTRRKWYLAAASVVAMGTGSVALAQFQAPEQVVAPVCVDFDKVATTAWSPEHRQAIASAFAGIEAAYAADTAKRVETELDNYVDRWLAARSQQCEAHERGEISDTLYDRSTACFDQRLAQLGTLVEGLAEGTPEVLEQASVAVVSLPAVEVCTNKDLLNAEVALPDDLAVATQVQQAREDLARAEAEILLGKYEQAQARAKPITALADELNYPPLRVESMLVSGSTWMWLGNGEKAAGEFAEAASLAVAEGSMADAAEAVAKKLFVDAELNGQAEDSWKQRWIAESLAERVPEDTYLQWLVANNLGVVAERAGETDLASDRYSRALSIAQVDDSLKFQEVLSLQNLGLLTVALSDFNKAQDYCQRSIMRAEQILGREHPLLPDFLYALSYIELGRGHPRTSYDLLRRAMAILNRPNAPTELKLQISIDLASVARLRRDPVATDHANYYEQHASEGSPWVQMQAIQIADLFTDKRSIEVRISELVQTSSELGEQAQVLAHRDASYLLWLQKKYSIAYEFSGALLEHAKALELPPLEVAGYHILHGAILSKLDRRDEAIEHLTLGLDNIHANNVDERPWAHKELGDIYTLQKDYTKAATHYREALTGYADYDADHPRLAEVRFAFAQSLGVAGESLSEARTLAEQALTAYRQLGDGFSPEQTEVESWLAAHPAG